jgi:hypothetical protein
VAVLEVAHPPREALDGDWIAAEVEVVSGFPTDWHRKIGPPTIK